MDPTVLSASTVLRMATSGGAEAIGLAGKVGALAVGMRADLIQVSFDDVHFVPTYDVISCRKSGFLTKRDFRRSHATCLSFAPVT